MEEDRPDNMEEGENSQGEENEVEQVASASLQTKTTRAKGKGKKNQSGAASAPEFPCLCCGDNCAKNQQSVQCIMCSLWGHKSCLKMSDTVFKSLEAQQKEGGTAYSVCRPCQNFAQRVQHQLGETNKRQQETDKKVMENSENIQKNTAEIEKLRQDMNKMSEKSSKEQETRDDRICEEMQEREVRRMNLILHGVEEPSENLRANRERMERDKEMCEEIFRTMKARTKKEDIRFCRRIGERRKEPRPIVLGMQTEEEKRHILSKSRDLQGTRFKNVSIVPDLTKKQRETEEKMKTEAEARNKNLSREDMDGGIRWQVIGRRGEKRIIKGPVREYQYGTNAGLRGGDEWWGQGPGGEQTGRGTQQRGVGSTSHAPRENGRGGWVGGHQQCTGTDQPTVQMPQGHGNLLAERSRGGGSQQLAQRFQHSLGYSQHQQGTDGQYPLNGGGGLSGGGGQIGGG